MKYAFLVAALLAGAATWAMEVPGKIFYELPSGELAVRDVSLDVPARGQGEVILKGEGFEWRSTRFHSQERAGRNIFTVSFPSEMHGKRSIVTLSGTYIRTSDKVLYYGDFYKKAQRRDAPHRFKGGFFFKFNR